MGCILALCFPDEQFIFACTADTQMMKHTGTLLIKNIFREEIYKKLHDQPILNDDESHEKLLQKIKGLNVKPEEGNVTSSYVEKVNKKRLVLNENPMKIARLRFICSGDEAISEYEN